MVEALPARLAEFGVFRTSRQAERHLQYAVNRFLRAVAPTERKPDAGRRRPTARVAKPLDGAPTRRKRRTAVS